MEVREEIRRRRRMVGTDIFYENVVKKDAVGCEGFHFSTWKEEAI